jgi:hypothetical protein
MPDRLILSPQVAFSGKTCYTAALDEDAVITHLALEFHREMNA